MYPRLVAANAGPKSTAVAMRIATMPAMLMMFVVDLSICRFVCASLECLQFVCEHSSSSFGGAAEIYVVPLYSMIECIVLEQQRNAS